METKVEITVRKFERIGDPSRYEYAGSRSLTVRGVTPDEVFETVTQALKTLSQAADHSNEWQARGELEPPEGDHGADER